MMQRYSYFLVAIMLGLLAGLYYGWVVNPVEGLQTNSDVLRQDYFSDYVLMVAEIYQSEQNSDLAIGRLDFLKSENPLHAISKALTFSSEEEYPAKDIELITDLDKAIRIWDPRLIETESP